ncbi:UDP-N-acetylmuramoyl-tripeptide--D-alanyl-D-alanine ligase [soil metagenome]
MKPATLEQIRQAIGGKALAPIPKTAPAVSVVCTDTRMLQPGCLFVALKGEKYDAHAFIPEAAAKGAIAAVVQDVPAQSMPNLVLIKAADTRVALGKIANFARKHMSCKVIAVAGSNGKTTTKYLINSVLSASLRGTMSPKSYNNDIGVPLTILPADPNADYLVLEMGTNHHGEIQRLTEMAIPDIAVITNCGAEHLEFLDDLRGVRQENASIVRGLRARGMLAVNGDDAELLSAVSDYSGKILKFGFDPDKNDLFASDVRCDANGTRFFLNNSRREIFVPMLGRHAALNALAAIAVARRLNLKDDEIMDALAGARGPDMRLQMTNVSGVSVLNDAYNANPNSMRAALETTANLQTRGRRVAVLGDMRELGESSERYHRELGEFAATCKLDLLACVGPQAAILADSAERAGMAVGSICRFPDARSAAARIPGFLREGDLILLKASRGIGLELVAQAISESRAAGTRRLRKVAS